MFVCVCILRPWLFLDGQGGTLDNGPLVLTTPYPLKRDGLLVLKAPYLCKEMAPFPKNAIAL